MAVNQNNVIKYLLLGGCDAYERDIFKSSIAKIIRLNTPHNDFEKLLSNNQVVHDTTALLKKDGQADFGKIFDDDQISSLIDQLQKLSCSFLSRDNGKRVAEGKLKDHSKYTDFLCHFHSLDLSRIKEIRDLIHAPNIISIAYSYFNCAPTLTDIALWQTKHNGRITGAQFFHHDRADFSHLKFFIYLTDVDEDSGPHEVCKKTHTYAELEKFYDKNFDKIQMDKDQFLEFMKRHRKNEIEVKKIFNVSTILGKSGESFFEDTNALHRAKPPIKDRLVLELSYNMLTRTENNLEIAGKIDTNSSFKPIYAYVNRLVYSYD